jgi:hypothetical protein
MKHGGTPCWMNLLQYIIKMQALQGGKNIFENSVPGHGFP